MPHEISEARQWVGGVFGPSMKNENKWMITKALSSGNAMIHRFNFVYLDKDLQPTKKYGKLEHTWTVSTEELKEYFLMYSEEAKELVDLPPISRKIRQMEKRQKFKFKGAMA